MVTVAMKLKDAVGRKAMTHLDSILKKRDYFVKKVRILKAMVFPVVMYGCESWTIKKAVSKNWSFENCGVGEDFWESPGLQGDQSQF